MVLLRGPSSSQQPCPATKIVGMGVPVWSARYPGRLPVRPLLPRPKAYEIAGRSTEILKNTIAESLIKTAWNDYRPAGHGRVG